MDDDETRPVVGFDLYRVADIVREADAKRKPGRPRIHAEPREELRIRLPVALVEAIRASGESLTGYVEQAVREKLERDSEKQTGAETGGSAHH